MSNESDNVIYVIDTSSLIRASEYFTVGNAVGYWERVRELVDNGKLISSSFVADEIIQKDGALQEWIKNVSHGFLEVDDEQQDLVGNIVNTYPNLVDLNSPVPEADPYVLALAILNKRKKKYSEVILFNEEIKTDINQKMKNKKSWKPRIPNVCEDYGIRSLTIRHLMPRENWTLR